MTESDETPTGTNLLGLVKHCAGVESGYFGSIMDRPFPGEELSGHMYATAAESREKVTDQETARHAGHADIIRESIDGAAGLRDGVSNLPDEADATAWKQHYDKVDEIAREAR
jgi:Protein of unknown function (DUF664)